MGGVAAYYISWTGKKNEIYGVRSLDTRILVTVYAIASVDAYFCILGRKVSILRTLARNRVYKDPVRLWREEKEADNEFIADRKPEYTCYFKEGIYGKKYS